MKKRLLLAVLLVVFVFGFDVSSATEYIHRSEYYDTARIMVSSSQQTASPGDIIDVTVTLTLADGVSYDALKVGMLFSSNQLELISYEKGSVYSAASLTLDRNLISWSMEDADISKSGVLFTCRLKVKAPALDNRTDSVYIAQIAAEGNAAPAYNALGIACEHSDTSEYVITEPGCTTTGEKVLNCNICGETLEIETIPATGHRWGEWTVVKEATTEEEGEEQRICLVCGETETRTLAQLNPTPTATPTAEPDVTSTATPTAEPTLTSTTEPTAEPTLTSKAEPTDTPVATSDTSDVNTPKTGDNMPLIPFVVTAVVFGIVSAAAIKKREEQ